MSTGDPERLLSIFDELDLDNPKERRIAVFALNDYYGATFAEVGEESLDFRPRDLDMGIEHQWKIAKSRFNELESIEIPDEYDKAILSINNIRGNIAHDFQAVPPQEILEESRRIAPIWAEWITELAEEYEEYQESLTATEALVQVGQRTIDYVKDSPMDYPPEFSRHQELLNTDANEFEQELESHVDDDEVSRELVNVISEILELERHKESLENEYRQRREEEAERRRELERAENTYNCIVVDEVDEFGRIGVVTNEPGQADQSYSFDIHHPSISQEDRETLQELETNDEVRIWIGRETTMDNQGQRDINHYIEEVR